MYIPQSCTVRIPVRLATFVWEHLRTKFGYFPNFFKYFRNRSKKTLLFVVSVPLRCFGCNFTFWTQKRFNCFLNKEKVAFTQSKRSTTASTKFFLFEKKDGCLFASILKKKMDAKFASTNCSSISCWLIQQNNFTNSSRKGLLYVQVSYKYIMQVKLQVS